MYRCQHCGALNNVKAGSEGVAVCGRCKEKLDLSGAPQAVDIQGLERTVASASVPVLVDFWAPWCGPCRAAAPIVEQLAAQKAGRLIALKVNTDENPGAGASYGFQGIPTFLVYRNGSVAGRQTGALPKDAFASWVTESAGG